MDPPVNMERALNSSSMNTTYVPVACMDALRVVVISVLCNFSPATLVGFFQGCVAVDTILSNI